MDFDNLHQVLRNLYQEMMPLCGDMIGVAKGIAGLGALFYVAYRVWKALASAEPIDVFPLLRPFAIGLCVMFFPTVVLGTINAVMSPVVQGTHAILEGQTLDLQAYQQQKDDLEAEARRREGKAWLVDDEVYEQRLADMGITDLGEIISMWAERTWYDIKAGFRQLVRDFFELLFNAAGLTIDTLRTFFFSRAVDSGALVVRPLHLRWLPLDARELDFPPISACTFGFPSPTCSPRCWPRSRR